MKRPSLPSSRVRPVDVPVPGDGADPVGAVVAGDQGEPTDGALPALMVAVEQVNGEHLPALDRGTHALAIGIVRIPDRALPEPGVARSDIHVASLKPEL